MRPLLFMWDMSLEETPDDQLEVVYRRDSSLDADEDARLRRLLFACFPHEPAFLSRRFLKERPAHRWLVFDSAREIVAHAAVHEKRITTARGELRIGGVAEVCVSSQHRGRGLAKRLLNEIHDWLRAHDFSFAMLFGQPPIYKSSGYTLITNPLLATNSLARHWNPFCGKPMIRALSGEPWPPGPIDLHGPTF